MNIQDRRAATCSALEQKLQSTTSPWDRLPLLIELATEPDLKKPEAFHQYAHQAVRLAQELGDPFWTAQSLHALGVACLWKEKYSEALRHLRQAMEGFERQGEQAMRMQSQLVIADTCVRMGELDEAIRLMIPCLHFFEAINDSVRTAFALRSLGNFYRTVGDHSEMIRHYRRAISIIAETGRHQDLGNLYLRLARGYGQMGYKSIERRYLFKSLHMAREAGHVQGLAWGLAGLAAHYISLNQCERAEKFVRLTILFNRMIGNTGYEGVAWGMMGTVCIDKGEKAKALRCFRKGLRLVRGGENPLFRGLLYERMGSLYVDLKEYDRGLACLKKGLVMIERSGESFYLFQTHQKLAQACELTGDTAGALYHFKEFSRLKDDHLNSRKFLEASRIDMQRKLRKVAHRLEKKRSQNHTLSQWAAKKEDELVSLTRKLMHEQKRSGKETATAGTGSSKKAGMLLPENWEIFARRFHKVHHGFYPQLVGRYPDLTLTEVKVCSLIRIGLSSKEIAEILCISKRTVDNHRARVHKKMQLPQGASLTGFIAHI